MIILDRCGVRRSVTLAHAMTSFAGMALKCGIRTGQAGNAVKLIRSRVPLACA